MSASSEFVGLLSSRRRPHLHHGVSDKRGSGNDLKDRSLHVSPVRDHLEVLLGVESSLTHGQAHNPSTNVEARLNVSALARVR